MPYTAGITQLVYVLNEAFAGPDWHSLRSNLRSLQPDDWSSVPASGQRSSQESVQHVGSCKLMIITARSGMRSWPGAWEHPDVTVVDAVVTRDPAIGSLTTAH
jgi:hypothetical protein